MKFSLVIPCYNAERYMKRCIESILNQSFTDFEAIFINDGSSDTTLDILEYYKKQDSRIKVFSQLNAGPVAARNLGFNQAIGEFIVCIDSDDYVEQNYLEWFDRISKQYSCDLISMGWTEITEDGKIIKKVPNLLGHGEGFYDNHKLETIFYPNLFNFKSNLCTKAFKKELIHQFCNEINPKLYLGEDLVLSFACVLKAKGIYLGDENLYYYVVNENSLTRKKDKFVNWEQLDIKVKWFEKHLPLSSYNLYQQLAKYVSHVAFTTCLTYFKNKKYNEAKKLLRPQLVSKDYQAYFLNSFKNNKGVEKIMAQILYTRNYYFMYIASKIK